MFRLFLPFMLVLGVFISVSLGAPAVASDQEGSCGLIAETSKEIMLSRQAGVAMVDIMKITEEMELGETFKATAKKMIMEAYESPLYQAEDGKKVAATEFQNSWYMKCLKAK